MYTFGQRLGLFFTIEGAFLSVVAVTSILCFVVYKWLRKTMLTWGKGRVLSADATDSSLFRNLMLADLVQAIGVLPNIRWMKDAEITEGHLCTAQAAIKQVGIVAVAMTSFAIAIHTFSILVLRWRAPRNASKFMVLGVWVFTAIVIGIPNATKRHERYYGDTGFWCWIVDKYGVERIVTEYLWVWISAAATVILYGITFSVMRGWFIIDKGIHWHKNYKSRHFNIEPETEEDKVIKAIANLMLFYPAVSIVCVLPNTVARWLNFDGDHPSDTFTFLANTLFDLSGLCNVLLFLWTRPDVVKGPSITIGPEDSPMRPRQDSSGGQPSTNLGRLPERSYPDDSTIEKWSGTPDFNPGSLIPAPHLYSPEHHTTFDSTLGGSSHVRKGSYLADKDDYNRSRESSYLVEEEENYGRLPR